MGCLGTLIFGVTMLLRPPPPRVGHDKGCARATLTYLTQQGSSMPMATLTTRSRRVKRSPPPKDGGSLSNEDSTLAETFTMHYPTPQPRFQGKAPSALMSYYHIHAYWEAAWCTSKLLEPSAVKGLGRCAQLKEHVGGCHNDYQGPLVVGQCLFFLTNSDCSTRVHCFLLWAVVKPSLHVYLWDSKGSDSYMRPLFEDICKKGHSQTMKPQGFQRFDRWVCGNQLVSLLHQLLQTDPNVDLWKFSPDGMSAGFVGHI